MFMWLCHYFLFFNYIFCICTLISVLIRIKQKYKRLNFIKVKSLSWWFSNSSVKGFFWQNIQEPLTLGPTQNCLHLYSENYLNVSYFVEKSEMVQIHQFASIFQLSFNTNHCQLSSDWFVIVRANCIHVYIWSLSYIGLSREHLISVNCIFSSL